jgi:16S rRNA (adenine1518-N6/adenine1519-N6)-dimethyltransferase
MVDESLLDEIVCLACLSESDVVLEVGAGHGSLTERIAVKNKVSAIEKESDLFRILSRKFEGNQNVDLIFGDALKIEYPLYDKIVSNIPYSISRNLIERFSVEGFKEAYIVVQREFAQKLMASPGCDEYRMVSVLAQTTCDIESLLELPAKAFRPQPKVQSALIKLTQKIKPRKDYISFLNALFSGKNRKLRNTYEGVPSEYGDLIPKNMNPSDFLDLYSKI